MNYELTPVIASCPICHSTKAYVLYSVNSEHAAQHFVLREVDPERHSRVRMRIEQLWQQPTCEVVRCNDCGFCYSNPYVAGDKRFYSLAYIRSGYPIWKWEYQLTYETLRESGMVDFRMLEIGAGNGTFVRRIAPSLTMIENILCTEYSDYGINELRKYGVSCLPEDIRTPEFEKYKTRFDVVCMFQVLEHMDGLDSLFVRLNWLTSKENASLFIVVPNPKRIEFHELNGALLDMPPNHVGRWNRECFEIIAKRYGWKVDRHETETTEQFISKLGTFGMYRYLCKSQISHTFANPVDRSRIATFADECRR